MSGTTQDHNGKWHLILNQQFDWRYKQLTLEQAYRLIDSMEGKKICTAILFYAEIDSDKL